MSTAQSQPVSTRASHGANGAATEAEGSLYYQELLRTVAQLREQSRRRDLTMAEAAHNLKTPVTVISGYLKLLAAERLGPVTAPQHQALQDMEINCARLQQAISEFLTYAAIASNKLELNFAEADLDACIEQACAMWLPAFEVKGVNLSQKPTLRLRFAFDRERIVQVIGNLLDNALKSTPAGGFVSVTAELRLWERHSPAQSMPTPERLVANSDQPNAVCITVSDTGSGIAAEFQQDIFEPFFSICCSGNSRPGTGLGLSIVRRIVLAHGGRVFVNSQVGRGSAFSILLPLQQVIDGSD